MNRIGVRGRSPQIHLRTFWLYGDDLWPARPFGDRERDRASSVPTFRSACSVTDIMSRESRSTSTRRLCRNNPVRSGLFCRCGFEAKWSSRIKAMNSRACWRRRRRSAHALLRRSSLPQHEELLQVRLSPTFFEFGDAKMTPSDYWLSFMAPAWHRP
jgi:hypothetical protein